MQKLKNFFHGLSKPVQFLLGGGLGLLLIIFIWQAFFNSWEIEGRWHGGNTQKKYSESLEITKRSIKILREGETNGSMEVKITDFDSRARTFKGVIVNSSGIYKVPMSPEIFFKYRLEDKKRLAFGVDFKTYPEVAPFGFYHKDMSRE